MVDPEKWLGLGERIGRPIIPPIKADVTYLKHENLSNLSGGGVVVIPLHPWRYFAKVELTNRSGAVAYIKRVTLRIGGAEYGWSETKPIRLETREFRQVGFTFPVSRDHSAIESGECEIEITPSVGRTTKVKGQYPILERET